MKNNRADEMSSTIEGRHSNAAETLKFSHRVYDLISSSYFKPKLIFKCLSICPEHIPLLARWGEDKWGYLRQFPGYEVREKIFREKKSDFYVGFYAGQPVAMFMLKDVKDDPKHPHLINFKYLTYVYVDEDYRGCGFGKQLMTKAKLLAKEAGAEFITFSTLTPAINQFYTQDKIGAKVVHEIMDYIPHDGKNHAYPAECLAIKL